MTTTTLALERPATKPGTDGLIMAMAIVGVLGAIGLAGSFENVANVAAERGMARPWLLPLGIDGGIAGFTWFELKLAENNKRAWWIGALTWGLTVATIALNVLGKTDPWEMVAHAALPLLWKASVAAFKTWTKRAVVTDRIPLARWMCAPWPTLRLWRRMKVWGITSYDAGLDLERRRMLARLEDKHGSLNQAPARKRELYRLIAAAAHIDLNDEPAQLPAPPSARASRPQSRRHSSTGRRSTARSPFSDDQLADKAVALAAKDPAVLGGWKSMAEALRAAGCGIGTKRAQDVLELARARTKETSL